MQLHSLSILAAVFAASTVCAQVVNDECSGAITIVDGVNGPFDNTGATNSSPAMACGGNKDIWFVYTATCSGTLTFETCSLSTHDTKLEVLSGPCGAQVSLGCNDDACSLQSRVSTPGTASTVYYVRVASWSSVSTGAFSLQVTCSPAAGADDECLGATALALGSNGPFSTIGYSTSLPAWLCALGGSDRWFSYQPTLTAPHTFYTCSPNTDFDTALELFDGTCGSLTSLVCNDDACGLQSSLTGNLTQGSTYYLRLGGFASQTGNAEVTVAIGTNTGSTTTYADACGGTTIAVAGNLNIAGSITTTLGGLGAGLPVLGYGFLRDGTNFCSTCNVGHDFSIVTVPLGGTETLILPADPALIGGSLFVQGVEIGGAGGCPGLGNFSDTVEIVIG